MNSDNTQQLTIYTPQSILIRPSALIFSMLRDLKLSLDLGWRLMRRDLAARYRQTILGYVWAFIPVVVISISFIFLHAQGFFSVGELTVPYAVFVFTGTVLWQFFADAVQVPIRIVKSQKTLITKSNFPREALIVSALGQICFDCLIRLSGLVIVLLCYQVGVLGGIPTMLFGMVSLLIIGLAIGIALIPLAALFEDIEKGLPLLMTLWFYLTPVVYPAKAISKWQFLEIANPVRPALALSRDAILGMGGQSGLPALWWFLTFFVLLLLAWIFYRVSMPFLVERFGS